jgi:methylglyoxal reductase
VGLLAYSPLARGLLSGRVRAGETFPASDHRSGLPWFSAENRARAAAALDRVRPIAEAHRISLANLAVAWVLGQPGVTAALVGARTALQAVENARAMTVTLSDEERREVGEAFRFEPA